MSTVSAAEDAEGRTDVGDVPEDQKELAIEELNDHGDEGTAGSSSPWWSPREAMRRLSALSGRIAVVTLVVLVLLLAAATTATVLLWGSAARYAASAQAATEAQAAAQSRVVQVLSYDFNTIDTALPEAQRNLTGSFRDDFARLGSSVIIPAAHRDSIITKAAVVGSSVVSADPDKVTLLLFLNQETTSARYQGPRLDSSRVRVTVARTAGDWLISEITPV